jgi:polysaccharide export outer membrane protein
VNGLLAAAWAVFALLVQSPAMATQAAAPAVAAADASEAYRVGPGDVLEIEVAQHPELARIATVQPGGTLRLPAAGELEVSGLTAPEIARRCAAALAAGGGALDVSVRVREHQSQFVWVRGAVARPGRKPLRGGTRLVDALLESGGFTPAASGELIVERPSAFDDGARERRLRLGAQPGPAELEALALRLAPGDVVTAATQRWVTVKGAVRRPGRYPLADGATAAVLVDAAGGALRGSAAQALVLRQDASGPRELRVDLDAVRRGQERDLPLAADDVLVVGQRRP